MCVVSTAKILIYITYYLLIFICYDFFSAACDKYKMTGLLEEFYAEFVSTLWTCLYYPLTGKLVKTYFIYNN